jgi:hypothetical protein
MSVVFKSLDLLSVSLLSFHETTVWYQKANDAQRSKVKVITLIEVLEVIA